MFFLISYIIILRLSCGFLAHDKDWNFKLYVRDEERIVIGGNINNQNMFSKQTWLLVDLDA